VGVSVRSLLVAGMVALWFLPMAACSNPASEGPTASKPEFCGWAAEIELNVPAPAPTVDPELPLDVDRLVTISGQLTDFARTLESAAAFAPSDKQAAFVELASFNREVALVITGSGSLRDTAEESARDAADVVVATLDSECGVRVDPASTLAFVGG
jgi:hypothetical protein